MPFVIEAALALGTSLAGSIIAKATVILAIALAGARLTRTRRAALRHALLAAAFAALLVLPIASLIFPSVRLIDKPINVGGIAAPPALTNSRDSAPAADPVAVVSGKRAFMPSPRLSPFALLLTGWAIGAVLFLLPVVAGQLDICRLRRSGRPWPHGQSLSQRLSGGGDVHHRIDVLLHESISGPVSCGVVRPTILLPIEAQTWPEEDIERAIIHEQEHVRRGDWASQFLARVVCAGYWFHPLVWIAWRRLRLEAERACDDAVLQRSEATAYADQLVALAERLSTPPSRPMLAMANRTDLAIRVAAVLDNRQQRGRAGKSAMALVAVASALLVMTMSPLRIVIAAQTPAATQTFTGSLIDPLGRTLHDARLTLWNLATGEPVDARSDQAGRFVFTGIPAGEYRLQVQGFGSQGQISLTAGQYLNRDIALLMGGGEYTVTVSAGATPTILPPIPAPLAPARTAQPYPGQADLDRCAQISAFCSVTPPVQIARVQPIYPARQRESGIAGTVVAEGRVGTDGLVKDVRTLAPADADFVSATLDALRRWQFSPMQLDGIPVEMSIHVTANFVVP